MSRCKFEDAPGIYKLTYRNPGSEFDGFIYIGQTNSIRIRMRSYQSAFNSKNGAKSAPWWITAIRKADKVFDFDKYIEVEILDKVEIDRYDIDVKSILNRLERQRINEFNSTDRSIGFNVLQGGTAGVPIKRKNPYARKRTLGKNAHKYEPLFVYDMHTNEVSLYASILAIKDITGMSSNEINTSKCTATRLRNRYIVAALSQDKRIEVANRLIARARRSLKTLEASTASIGSISANKINICDRIIGNLMDLRYIESYIAMHYSFPVACNLNKNNFIAYLDQVIQEFNEKRSETSLSFNSIMMKNNGQNEIVIWNSMTYSIDTYTSPYDVCKALDITPKRFDRMLNLGMCVNGIYAYYSNAKMRDNTMRNVRNRASNFPKGVNVYKYMCGYMAISGLNLDIEK